MDEEDLPKDLPTPRELFSLIENTLGLPHRLHPLGLYILDGHEPVPIDNTLDWARWYEQSDKRRVARTSINGWDVSTVFLGIDNNLCGSRPLLFETMIFSENVKLQHFNKAYRKSMDNYTRRYETWDEAVAGHQEACRMIREGAQ